MRDKKKRRILLLVLLLLAVTVGFAALATTLIINGSTNITKQTWDIYWDDAETYPIDIYDAENYGEALNYDDYGYPDANYSISYFVEGYKGILEDAGAIIKEARLLTYSEATASNMCDGANFACPTSGTGSFITNTSFWLGSADTQYDVWYILSDGSLGSESFDYNVFFGVRPVVVVEKSNL